MVAWLWSVARLVAHYRYTCVIWCGGGGGGGGRRRRTTRTTTKTTATEGGRRDLPNEVLGGELARGSGVLANVVHVELDFAPITS